MYRYMPLKTVCVFSWFLRRYKFKINTPQKIVSSLSNTTSLHKFGFSRACEENKPQMFFLVQELFSAKLIMLVFMLMKTNWKSKETKNFLKPHANSLKVQVCKKILRKIKISNPEHKMRLSPNMNSCLHSLRSSITNLTRAC